MRKERANRAKSVVPADPARDARRRGLSRWDGRTVEDESYYDKNGVPSSLKPPDMLSDRKRASFSVWRLFSRMLTCLIPSCCLSKCGGLRDQGMQQAWREKVALCMLIFFGCLALGFLQFGFTTFVCRPPAFIYKHSEVKTKTSGKNRWFIIRGTIYNVPFKYNPYSHSDVPYDVYSTFAGSDVSPFFPPHPSSACAAAGIVSGGLECTVKGSEVTFCHSPSIISKMDRVGTVTWNWNEIEASDYLIAYNGLVLDVSSYLDQIPISSPTPYGKKIDSIFRSSVGGDATKAISTLSRDEIQCLLDEFGAGTVDVKSVGCILTDVILYLSLVAILAVIFVKFILAVTWTCCMSKKFSSKGLERVIKKESKKPFHMDDNSNLDRPLSYDMVGGRKVSSRYISTSNNNSDLMISDGTSYMGNTHHNKAMSSQVFNDNDPTLATAGELFSNPEFSFSTSLNSQSSLRNGRKLPSEIVTDIGSLQSTIEGYDQNCGSTITGAEDSNNTCTISIPFETNPHPIGGSFDDNPMYSILVVTCYSEEETGLRTTIESLLESDIHDSHKLLFVVADGLITGSGNDRSTPQILVEMMDVDQKSGGIGPSGIPWSFFASNLKNAEECLPLEEPLDEQFAAARKPLSTKKGEQPMIPGTTDWMPEAFSYVAIADGEKRHNMARIYGGHFCSNGHRVPAVVVVKCGTPNEATQPKPGNRGKRDSQILLMNFLSKVLFGDRMTPLEYDLYRKIRYLTHITADKYEAALCVDADTKVEPDALRNMLSVLRLDPTVMGLCGETRIANKGASWVTAIQVFEYFISHHLNKSFESVFGVVTCLPGCFCMYRIKAPKGLPGCYVPILASPDIIDSYAENVTDTLHKVGRQLLMFSQKNLLLLGEDRYLTTLMLKTFPKRKMLFIPKAKCRTQVPDTFSVLLSQRRRWINSTVHNLFELVLVNDLCGTFCCSMQFIIFMELLGTLVLPAAIVFTGVLITTSIIGDLQYIPLGLLIAILGLPAFLIFFTRSSLIYAWYMLCYLIALPIWNFVLPVYAYWHFDDFSWGETRKIESATKDKAHGDKEGVFDSSQIFMRRLEEYEAEIATSVVNFCSSSGKGLASLEILHQEYLVDRLEDGFEGEDFSSKVSSLSVG